jgi:predicted PurR-regulated permease PerM
MEDHKLRGAFLLLLALVISALFFRMIQSFAMALLLAAIFAGLAYPAYERVLRLVKGRKSLAALATLLLGLVLAVVPAMGLATFVAREAAEISASVGPWVGRQLEQT